MELHNPGKALKVLDRLEGYHGRGCSHNLYNRIIQEVEIVSGERAPACLYIWGRPEDLGKLGNVVPGGDWRMYKNL